MRHQTYLQAILQTDAAAEAELIGVIQRATTHVQVGIVVVPRTSATEELVGGASAGGCGNNTRQGVRDLQVAGLDTRNRMRLLLLQHYLQSIVARTALG